MNLLEFKSVSFVYDGKEIVRKINCSLGKGEYMCVVGENGSGKTTFVKGILGLKKASEGKIIMENGLSRNKVGYLSQHSAIQKDFPATVHEVVLSGRLNSLGLKPFFSKRDKEIAAENMRILGVDHMKRKSFSELSGGQKQRVLLARALCATKELIVLDEPEAGLDPIVTKELYKIINSINKDMGIGVIIVSHDVKEAAFYANKILHIHDGIGTVMSRDEYLKSELGLKFMGGYKDDRVG